MKFIDRMILTIFSVVMLLEAVAVVFLIFGWLSIQSVVYLINDMLNNYVAYNIFFTVNILFIIFAIKGIFFVSSSKKEKEEKRQDKLGEGVLLENDDGKLLISRETIERLASTVVKGFDSVQDSKTRVLIDSKNYIRIIVELQIVQNTVIRDLNTNIQTRIKSVIKEATDLEVDEIDIKVKNILNVPQKNESAEYEDEDA